MIDARMFARLLKRELALVFGSPVTWLVVAASALLVGHGFVLAVDLYSAASRSAVEQLLMRREMDPLAGVTRPTLGGLELSAALLLPLAAARGLAIEKERRSSGSLALHAGSTDLVVLAKLVAALAGGASLFVTPIALFVAFRAAGGHVDALETAVALLGHELYVVAVVCLSVAAAAATRSFAQAAALTVLVSLGSWAIEAGEGFSALAWLDSLEWASIGRKLAPFEKGIVELGACSALLCFSLVAAALAFIFARRLALSRRLAIAALPIFLGIIGFVAVGRVQRGYDLSEARRASLPVPIVEALRALPRPLSIEIWLDRDDGRRSVVERDALEKLVLARPDLEVVMPLDQKPARVLGVHADGYGRIVVRVAGQQRETRSTSRRELATLFFETAARPMPAWMDSTYPGYPSVVSRSARSALGALAYFGLPGAALVAGLFVTRRRTRRA